MELQFIVVFLEAFICADVNGINHSSNMPFNCILFQNCHKITYLFNTPDIFLFNITRQFLKLPDAKMSTNKILII